MTEKKEISAIILAGGKSSRMMQDKGLIRLHDKMMIEHVIERLEKIFPNIIIISQNPAYRQFGYPCFKDIYKDSGPLGGIYTGLMNTSAKKSLVVGCDTPFLPGRILAALIEKSNQEDVLITEHDGKAEPLFAVYDRNCIPHFKTLLENGRFKIIDALHQLNTCVINFDNEEWITADAFANINTPEELLKYENNKK